MLKLETDDGTIGWGEVCSAPLYYLPELPGGTREGIHYVAPLLLGQDPRQVLKLSADINVALRGHGNAGKCMRISRPFGGCRS